MRFSFAKLGPNSIAIIFFAFVVLALWHLAMRGMRGGREITLAECTNTVTTVHFKTEMGQYFQLTFASNSNSPSKYPGHVHLVNSATEQTADFDTDSNYFYTISANPILRPDSQHEMTVTFPKTVQPATLITLHWLQRVRDRGK